MIKRITLLTSQEYFFARPGAVVRDQASLCHSSQLPSTLPVACLTSSAQSLLACVFGRQSVLRFT